MCMYENDINSIKAVLDSSSDDSWKAAFLNIYDIYLRQEIEIEEANDWCPKEKAMRAEIKRLMPKYEPLYDDKSVTNEEIDDNLWRYKRSGMFSDTQFVLSWIVSDLMGVACQIKNNGATSERIKKLKSLYLTYFVVSDRNKKQ